MANRRQFFSTLRSPLFRLIVLSGAALLLLAFIILRYEGFFAAVRYVLHAVRPLLLGVLFATMLAPSFDRLHSDLTAFAERRRRKPHTRLIRMTALAGAALPPLLIFISIICVLIPQLGASLRLLGENLGSYGETLRRWFAHYPQSPWNTVLPAERLEEMMQQVQGSLPELLLKTYGHTAAVLRCFADIGIGAVFSMYLLADRDRLLAGLRRLAARSAPHGARWLSRLRLICETFARFLNSQFKESLILGGLCFLGMLLFHFPYPLLISVLVGITNIVPYFGPVAGAIPSMLLILLADPKQALWFLLFIVILQQLESNLIYPRIVGGSVGLPPVWVLAAIVVGGGLFGIAGLLLGVPLAAAAYALAQDDGQENAPGC